MNNEEIRKIARNNCRVETEQLADVLIHINEKLGGLERDIIEGICSIYNLGFGDGQNDIIYDSKQNEN